MDEQQSSSQQSQDPIIADLINIKIKTIDSKNYQFQVENDISIKALKEKIASTVDIDPDSQRMIFCGRVLANEKTLKFYKIDDGKVIHVVKRTQPPARNNDSTNNNRNPQSNQNSTNSTRNPQSRFSTFRSDDGSSVYMGTFSLDPPASIINQVMRQIFSNRNGTGNNQTDQTSQSSSSQESAIRNRFDQIRRLHYYIGTNFDILENHPFLRNSDQQIRPTDENHQITTAEYMEALSNTLQYMDRLRPYLNQFLNSSNNNNNSLNVSDNISIIMRINHHLSHVSHLLSDFQVDPNNLNSPIRLNTLNLNQPCSLNATSATGSSGANASTNQNQNNSNNNNENSSTSDNTNDIRQQQSQNSSSTTQQQETNNSSIESQAEILSSLTQSTIAESAAQNPFPRSLGTTSIPLPGGNGSVLVTQSPILLMEVDTTINGSRGPRSISNLSLSDFNVTLNNLINSASNAALNSMLIPNSTDANTANNNVNSTSSTANNNSNSASVHSNASNTNCASSSGSANQQSNETNNGQQQNSNASNNNNNNNNSNSTPMNPLQSFSMRFDPFLPCSSAYTLPEIRSATNLGPITASITPDSIRSLFEEVQNSDSSAPNDFDMLTELGNLLNLDNPTNRPNVHDGSQPFFDFLRFLLDTIEQLAPGGLSMDFNGDHGPITIGDYMRRFNLFQSDDNSFMSRMFSVLLQNLSFENFHQLFNFNFRDFGRLRQPLHEFIRANLLTNNQEYSIENVRNEIGTILDQNETLLINVTQNLHPAVGVDLVKSLRIFLRETLVKFLDQIMRSSNDENFEQDVTSALNYLISSYIHFCNACFASPGESRIQLIQNYLNQFPELIDSHFITLTIALLKIRIDAVAQNLSDEYRAEVINNIVFNGESRPVESSSGGQCDEQSNSYDSEVEFADACSDILPPSTASTSATIDIVKNVNNRNDSANPQQQSAPEEWEAVVPDEWVQTIKEDVEKQKNIDNDHLPPFSEAYLNGMSKKRRHEHDQQPK